MALTGSPQFGAVLSDGKTLLMPHQGDDAISIIDTAASIVVSTVTPPASACTAVQHLDVSDDDRTAWLVCEGDRVKPGSLVTIDLGDLQAPAVTGFAPTGVYPNALEVLPPAP
jgi:hypothetical protein